MEYTNAILVAVSFLSSLAAVLAWVSKLKWSKEYLSVKNEIIKTKDAQIALLQTELSHQKELSPVKLREYFTSVKAQLEEYNESLQSELEQAQAMIIEKELALSNAIDKGEAKEEAIKLLKQEIDKVRKSMIYNQLSSKSIAIEKQIIDLAGPEVIFRSRRLNSSLRLEEHLNKVALSTGNYKDKFSPNEVKNLLDLLHDFDNFSTKFQQYVRH